MTDPTANNCCSPECDIWSYVGILDYSLDWTEIAGTWIYGNASGVGYIETTGVGAIALPIAGSTGTWNLNSRFRLTWSGSGSTWRMVVAGDANNYLFIEFRHTIVTTHHYIRFLVGKVQAASLTYLSPSHAADTDHEILLNPGQTSIEFNLNLALDDDNGTLTGDIRNTNNTTYLLIDPVSVRGLTSLGDFPGFFVVSLSGTLRISHVLYQHISPDIAHCTPAIQSKTRGLPLEEVVMEINGTPTTFLFDTICTFDCSNITGSRSLMLSPADWGSAWRWNAVPLDAGGYSDCVWTSEEINFQLQMHPNTVVGFGVPTVESRTRLLTLVVSYFAVNGLNFQSFNLATFQAVTAAAMEDWVVDEWIDLTKTNSLRCAGSSDITARIKRV